MRYQYERFGHPGLGWRNSSGGSSYLERSLQNDELFSELESNKTSVEEDHDNETDTYFESPIGEEEDIFDMDLKVSTATLAVSYCIVVCVFFLFISLQHRFDGDFMGGLVHAIVIISLTIVVLMIFTRNIVWPRLWYAGFGAFFLWFFHRMVVFPLIALIFPFKMYQTSPTPEDINVIRI